MPGWGWVTAVAAAAWLYLLVAHGRFWTAGVRLPTAGSAGASVGPAPWPAVTVVVPARDEADVLPATLPTLLRQDYPGPLRVTVVDDRSGDGTAVVAARLGATVLAGSEPPAGWAGKVWAMHTGVGAAGDAEWLLLTDADIAHPPDSVRRLVGYAREHHLDQVSLMARLSVRTRWERLVVPAFVYFFAQLYPFRRVARPGGRTAAAAGGCVLVRRAALQAAGGMPAIRGALIDDVSLARAVKRAGGRIWLGLADDVHSLRPYPRLADLWAMVARSAYTQLRHSPILLAGTAAGLLLLYAVPPVATIAAAATGAAVPLALAAGAWVAMTASYLPTVRYHRLGWWWALTLPVAAVLYLAMTLDSARRHRGGRGGAWKGRTAPAR